ncbi:hypothetical protein CHL_1694 [Campylobacter hyointestinalis subsp. lawsonii CCUG 27631]|uniref:hypothetical protein n=1 Tax=Campylobacter hyointestinalis TaxID=198 RepID=UPI0007C888E5|nr:hypothetical protein [Campylobacter hyointestinalis]ANE34995.1 hypothetical protein CHL_1694 [Campylobacter hyointestinalis subsp. lawsonii CCUG 27631]
MKRLLSIVSFCIFMVGCSSSNSVLLLSPYQAKGVGSSANSIVINSIIDKRKNQSVIATISDKQGTVSEYVTMGTDLTKWFGDALKTELIKSGVKFGGEDSKIVDITITELKANLSGYSRDNLKGNCEVYIKIYKDGVTTTKRIAQPQTEFAPILTGGAFEPFIQSLLNDMVVRTAKAIVKN